MTDTIDKIQNNSYIEDEDHSSEVRRIDRISLACSRFINIYFHLKPDAGEAVDSDEYDDNEYCTCRGRDDGTFMIQCDRCTEWYHGKCIQVTRRKVKEVEKWVCPFCEAKIKAGKCLAPRLAVRC